jgi:thiol-disulfide isomerase/thioredoxin
MRAENLFILAGGIIVLLLMAGQPLMAGEYNWVMSVGDLLPRFGTFPATDDTMLSLNEVSEEVLVLAFLANHCPWVRGAEADLINLADAMKGKSVRIVGVSVNHREEDRLPAMKKHASEVGYNFTYIFDKSQDLGRKLGAARTPVFFVFDSGRRLVYTGLLHNSPGQMRRNGSVHYSKGEPTEFYVRDAIKAALDGRESPVPETRAHGCNIEYVR